MFCVHAWAAFLMPMGLVDVMRAKYSSLDILETKVLLFRGQLGPLALCYGASESENVPALDFTRTCQLSAQLWLLWPSGNCGTWRQSSLFGIYYRDLERNSCRREVAVPAVTRGGTKDVQKDNWMQGWKRVDKNEKKLVDSHILALSLPLSISYTHTHYILFFHRP